MSSVASSLVLMGAIEKEEMSSSEAAFFQSHELGGVILFRRNIAEPYSLVINLTSKLQNLNPHYQKKPLIVAIDQEGGRVRRIWQNFPNLGPALNLFDGAFDHKALQGLHKYGSEIGLQLSKLGICLNLAPVLDILTNEGNSCIGDRSFGHTVEAVTARAGSFLDGMQSKGVFGCLKHFPGQGDANEDTHQTSARIDVSVDILNQRELKPFVTLLPKAKTVMISHSIYSALDEREASLSSKVIRDLLRQKLKFGGLVISDDMNMAAIPQSEVEWQESLVEAIVAGNDLLIIGRHLERLNLALEGLKKNAQKSKAFAHLLDEAAQRVIDFKKLLSPKSR